MIDSEGRRLILERNGQLRSSLVYSPGVIKAEAETTNAIISQMALDVNTSPKVPAATRNAFGAFVAEWTSYYKSIGFLDRLVFSTMEKIQEFRKRAAEWRKTLQRAGAKFAAPSDKHSAAGVSLPQLPWKWILGGVGVAVGLFFVVKIMRSSLSGAAQLAEAEQEAVRIAATKRKASKKVVTIS